MWLSSESMSRRIWRASSNCSALSMRLRIMKLTARRVSITLRRMRPFRSSWRAIAESASPAAWSVTFLAQHARAHRLEAVVDAFERVGRVLGVGVVELEQHVLGVADQRRDAARAQAQQAKHRQVLGVDREQHVAVKDEGDADVARRSRRRRSGSRSGCAARRCLPRRSGPIPRGRRRPRRSGS